MLRRRAGDSSIEDADAVAEICRRLDGIPLAIELAASRMLSMTATEVRDRLDDRFRLLVGSRRGLERHQTLRHAVQWSYDLLDEHEKALLNRCSVFAGGFDLAGACAVAGSDDDIATLDLLDALVRKSLLVGRPVVRPDPVLDAGDHPPVRRRPARDRRGRPTTRGPHTPVTSPAREADVLALWDSPRQREAYTWFGLELANLRAAFNWATDSGDLESAAVLATYGAFLGVITEVREPLAWVEAIIPSAKKIDHPRLAQLYVYASWCYTAGRLEDAEAYARAARSALDSGRYQARPLRL